MKRLVAILFLTILLVCAGVIELVLINNFIENVQQNVLEIYNSFPQNEDQNITFLTEKVIKLKEYWDDKEDILCILHNHKDLGVTTNTISSLKVNIEENKYVEAKQDLIELMTQVKKLPHTITFSIQNIF